MDFLLILIPIIAVSAYTASLASRMALRRGRQPGWNGILGSSLATAVIILVVGYLGVLSVPGDVMKIGGFRYWTRVAPVLFVISIVVAVPLSAAVGDFYRRRAASKRNRVP